MEENVFAYDQSKQFMNAVKKELKKKKNIYIYIYIHFFLAFCNYCQEKGLEKNICI